MVKILIIDDSPSIRNLLKHALAEFECMEIDEAENGLEGIHKIKAESYNLIICDSDMPIMSGIETITKTRKVLYKSTPIIALSTKSEINLHNIMVNAGASSVLIKPLTPKSIIDSVKEYVKT